MAPREDDLFRLKRSHNTYPKIPMQAVRKFDPCLHFVQICMLKIVSQNDLLYSISVLTRSLPF